MCAAESDPNEKKRDYYLVERGFDPTLPVNEFFGCFTLEQAKSSLFDSTYSNSVPVYLSSQEEHVRIPVVITKAEARYVAAACDVGFEEHPNWYFEGWVPKHGADPEPGIVRVRIFVSTRGEGEFDDDDIFGWQRIPNADSVSDSTSPS